MKEIWKDIKGFENLYSISNMGNVKSLERLVTEKTGKVKRVKEKTLSLCYDKDGYYSISLWDENKGNTKKAHRLVAQAFIPNPENKRTVNHKNGIKTDNRIENLEWMTIRENCKHAYSTGIAIAAKGEGHPSSKFTNDDILDIRNIHKLGLSQANIGRIMNIDRGYVSRVISKKRWKHI